MNIKNNLPVAIQIIGRQRADLSVLKAMKAFEEVIDFKEKAKDF